MNLIKLTMCALGNEIYINSNCILSCERKFKQEKREYYTEVGVLYENKFQFLNVRENIPDIQEQLER